MPATPHPSSATNDNSANTADTTHSTTSTASATSTPSATSANHTAQTITRLQRQGTIILWTTALLLIATLALSIVLVVINPADERIAQLVGIIILLPAATAAVRAFNKARARTKHIQVTATQFPQVHEEVLNTAEAMGVQHIPNIYIVTDASIDPCTVDLGTHQSIRIGSDFLAGCRENNTPEALSFMIAHQLGHIAARHNRTGWNIVSNITRNVPILSTLIARNLEYTADAYANYQIPHGTEKALALCAIGKDNFPYVNAEQQIATFEDNRGFWRFLALWTAGIVTPAQRLTTIHKTEKENGGQRATMG